MKEKFLHIILFLSAFICISFSTYAQDDSKAQNDVIKRADGFFSDEDYVSAMPLYSQLLSVNPKDPEYNYRFGVCVLYADRRETDKPIRFLEYASTKPDIDVSVFYYLGMSYQNNYRFQEAVTEYNLYKEKAGEKNASKHDVDRQIEVCNNAPKILTHATDLYVLQRTEVPFNDFFRSYDVERFGGKILVKPDAFKTPLDRKREKFGLIFYSKESKEAYFSSYGKDGKNGKDIYKVIKLANGKWSDPINLGPTINTPYDEDYPFMTPDGTLYYCSKGGNTIGGYDIFSSTLKEDGTWTTPENLNYPINSPFDDIMFVPDSSGKYAYFSSVRSSLEGMITVYKVRIDKRPTMNETLVLDKPISTSSVADETSYTQSIQYLKEKANLDVNATEKMFEDKNTDKTIANNNKNITEDVEDKNKIPDNITNDDILKIANKQANDTKLELNNLKTKREAAYSIARKHKQDADSKYNEANTIIQNADTIKDTERKENELAKASKIKSDANQLNRQSSIATTIANQLDQQVEQKQKESDEATKYATDINSAVRSKSKDSSIALLSRMTEKLKNTPSDTANFASSKPNNDYIQKKELESNNYTKQADEVRNEITTLKEQADNYRKQADNTRRKSEKETYIKNADDIDAQIKSKQDEADELLQRSDKSKSEVDSAKAQSDLFASVVNDIKNNNTGNNQVNNTTADNTTKINTQNTNQTINTKTNNLQADNSNNKNILPVKNTSNTVATNKNEQDQGNKILAKTNDLYKKAVDEADDLKKRANNMTSEGNTKDNLSTRKLGEADSLLAAANKANNDGDKNILQHKSDSVRNISKELAQQASADFAISKDINDSYKKKQEEINKIDGSVNNIKELVNSNNLADANTKLDDLIKSTNTNTNVASSYKQYQSELSNSLDGTQYQLEQASNFFKELKSKTDSLSLKEKELKREAKNAKASKRDDIEKQANDISNQLSIIQKQADSAAQDTGKLKIEVGELRVKIRYVNSLVNEENKQTATAATNESTSNSVNINSDLVSNAAKNNETETNPDLNSQNNAASNNTTQVKASEPVTDSNLVKAGQKRLEANKTSDPAKKKELLAEAYTLENNAKSDQIEYQTKKEITNADLFQDNSKKIDQIRVTDDNNPSVTAAHLLENESSYYYDKAKALQKSINDNMSADQKISIMNDAESNEQIALQKQAKAIAIYSNVTPSAANNTTSNIAKNTSGAVVNSVPQNNEANIVIANNIPATENKNNQGVVAENKNKANNSQITNTQNTNQPANVTPDIGAATNNTENKAATEKSQNNENPVSTTNSASNTQNINQSTNVTPDSGVAIIKNNATTANNQNNENPVSSTNKQNTNQSTNVTPDNVAANNNVKNNTANTNTQNNENNVAIANIASNANTQNTNQSSKTNPDTNNLASKSNKTNIQDSHNDLSDIQDVLENNFNNTGYEPIHYDSLDITVIKVPNQGNSTVNLDKYDNGLYIIKKDKSINSETSNSNSGNPATNTNQALNNTQNTGLNNTSQANNVTSNTTNVKNTTDTINNNTQTINKVNITYANNPATTNKEGAVADTANKVNNTGNNETNTVINTKIKISATTIVAFKGIYLTDPANFTPVNVDADNLIPLNPALPSGVVFKVQICAVKRHVDPETFSGISPVSGEVTPTGLIRYVAGLFATYEDADAAKNRIRSMGGYMDDFVVAYYNGNRITIAEAMDLLKKDNSLLKSYADLSNTSYFGSGSTTRYNPPAINNVNPPVIANSGLNNPVSNLNGFFYSVQVGVYARPVTSAQLFNISPLNDEKMANGYYRYISGTFQNVKDAIAAKNEIVRKGVTDAFVVAYNNGKQISLVEARGLAGNNITPPQNNNPVITNNTETATSSDDKTGIEFKVQLGAFAKDVPIEVVNKLLELVTGNGLEHGKNDEGLTVFTTGHFKDFRSADDYKSSLVENGIKDAFVVAFQHGNKISVTKAIELTK